MHNLTAGYLSTPQSAGTTDSHSLSPGLHGAKHGLLHRPAESNTMLNLLSYRPSYQKGVKFRLLNLQDAQLNPLADELLEMRPHFIDSLSPPPDDNAGSSGMDIYRYLIRLAVNLHQGDTGVSIASVNSPSKLEVFLQEFHIVLLGKPPSLPVAYDSKSEAERMNLMTQLSLLLGNDYRYMARALKNRTDLSPRPRAEPLSRPGFIGKDADNP